MQKRLKTFSVAALAASVLAAAWLLSIPASAKNAWIMGLSKTRIFMLLPLIGLTLLWLWVTFQTYKNEQSGARFLHAQQANPSKWILQSLTDLCALLVPMGVYLLIKWNFFIDTGFDFQTVVQRINPYLLLVTLYSLAFLLLYYPRLETDSDTASASVLGRIQRELIRHKTFPLILAGLAICFIAAHFMGWRFQMDEDLKWSLLFFAQEFNLDNENVLSAYFSGFILFSAGCLLVVIAADRLARRQPMRVQWSLLALIFFYLSADEVLGLHENLSLSGSGASDINQLFYFKWVPVAILFLTGFALLFIRFFLLLPNRSKILFALSGMLYLGGVLGVEIIAGRYMAAYNEWGYEYLKLAALEEGLEMFGAIFFNFSLLDYIRHNDHSLQ
jgi:hypothetical protein